MHHIACIVGALLFTLSIQANAGSADPDGYNSCVIRHIEQARTDAAIEVIQRICARQNNTNIYGNPPIPYTPRALQSEPPATAPITWSSVVESERFQAFSTKERELVQSYYLEWILLPGAKDAGFDTDKVVQLFHERTDDDVHGYVDQD